MWAVDLDFGETAFWHSDPWAALLLDQTMCYMLVIVHNALYFAGGFIINGMSPMVLIFWIGAISIASLDFGYTKGFEFFTNYESNKGQELLENNKVSLVFFWPELPRHRQL